jgi:ankyrin repeat protein
VRGDAEDVARLLQDNSSLLEAEDDEENRPIHLAATWGSASVVSVLLERGADVHAPNGDENTALHLAARLGALEVGDVLLRGGAVATCRNEWNETPLILAAEEGHVAMVERLLSRGEVEVDARDVDGHTALCCACIRGEVQVARLLLRAGADPGSRNVDGRTPRQEAQVGGHANCVELLQVRRPQRAYRKMRTGVGFTHSHVVEWGWIREDSTRCPTLLWPALRLSSLIDHINRHRFWKSDLRASDPGCSLVVIYCMRTSSMVLNCGVVCCVPGWGSGGRASWSVSRCCIGPGACETSARRQHGSR